MSTQAALNAKRRRLFLMGVLFGMAVGLATAFWLGGERHRTARIASGSMAPTLYGPHWQNICRDCGFTWRVGQDIAPDRERFVCPNCGYAQNDLQDAGVQRGQQVDLHSGSYKNRRPQRGDMVAFRKAAQKKATPWAVKRIVGLPGEQVSIQGGDLYIDGAIWKKPWQLFQRQAVLVHDSRFSPQLHPANKPPLPLRWRPRNDGPRNDDPSWRFERGRYQYAPPTDAENAREFHWLVYHHWLCSEIPQLRTKEAAILDGFAYNVGPARQLQAVTDVVLECELTVQGEGEIALELRTVNPPLTCKISAPAGQVTLLVDNNPFHTFRLPPGSLVGKHVFTFGVLDRQAVLALDGVLQCSPELPNSSQAPKSLQSKLLAAEPFQIGARGVALVVGRRRILRDVYYLDPLRLGRDWSTKEPLSADVFFVLGDNPPLSIDSRQPNVGPIHRQQIVGQVHLAPQ